MTAREETLARVGGIGHGLGITQKPDWELLPITVSEPLHTSLRRWERLRRELTMTAWATLLGITIVQNRWFSALCAGPPGKDTDTAAGAAGSRRASCAQSTTLCRYILDALIAEQKLKMELRLGHRWKCSLRRSSPAQPLLLSMIKYLTSSSREGGLFWLLV